MLQRALSQLFPVEYPHAVHRLSRLRSHAPEILYRQRCDEVESTVRVDGKQSVGFAVVRGYLGEKLVVRHSRTCCQLRLLSYSFLYLPCYVLSEQNLRFVAGHVEKSLVDRQWFYQVCIALENGVYLSRHLFVHLMPARHDNQFLAQLFRLCHRHSRAHSISPCLIARRRHHTTWSVEPHGNRFAAQLRIVSLFHCRKEGIHVDVYYLSDIIHWLVMQGFLFVAHACF